MIHRPLLAWFLERIGMSAPETVTPFRLLDSLWNDGEYINDIWYSTPGMEGNGKYYGIHQKEGVGGLLFSCPGCRQICSCSFAGPDNHPKWIWDGNREKPTLTPSIWHNRAKGGCGWHGFLTAGIFRGRIE